ncbi:MAG: type II toxin-antitoxin system VapB family antitoxin [Gemmatimonadaceae bacterium]|nr:type II toxin-antitoxin system VapB family antitoxin [Gemmatimonadaceae bacterium]
MQRTTVRLPEDLLNEAKEFARKTSRTLTQLLEDAVRAELMLKAPRELEQAPPQIADLQHLLRSIPDRDARTADDILGYDANGLPR